MKFVRKTTDQHDNQDRQSLPQHDRAALYGEDLSRIARCQTICARAYNFGKKGDHDALLAQIKFLNGSFLLLGRHDALFRNAGHPRRGNTSKANQNA
jgi:hypothetical protein